MAVDVVTETTIDRPCADVAAYAGDPTAHTPPRNRDLLPSAPQHRDRGERARSVLPTAPNLRDASGQQAKIHTGRVSARRSPGVTFPRAAFHAC